MTDARTTYTALEQTAAQWGNLPALHQPLPGKGEQKHKVYTWLEFKEAAEEIACGLRHLGIGKGDIVALDSETRAEFYLADMGIMANGSIAAALYTSYPTQELVKTLFACDAKAVFVENPKALRELKKHGTPQGIPYILLTGEAEGATSLENLRASGRAAMAAAPGLFSSIRREYGPADYAILYLTSGATGEPKMGLVTHQSLILNCDMGPKVLPIGPQDRTLVFLPSAHIAQRLVLELMTMRMGVPVWFSESLAKMPNELRTIRPTFFLAPPRVWERVFSSITTEIRKRPAFTRKLFYGALGLGLRAARLRRAGKAINPALKSSLKLADKVVFRKIRARLGGELRIAASGAAPLGKDLAEFFEAIGLPLIEGYGLTEGGVATLNPLDGPKPGSIGKALPGVELRIEDDGELTIKSPCLFSGYYKDSESTAAVLRDGWLYTGDIAEIDSAGFVFITGRKKEMIVSSNGKKIYPSRIENLFKVEPVINQVLLVGDRLPYVTALFTINSAALETVDGLATAKSMDPAELASAKSVQEEVKKAVARVNQRLASFEQIRKFRILEREFSIEHGELTPTMKVRRAKVLENFKAAVNDLYAGKEDML
jgi:long-chain acyl-CoA synthetase